MDVSSGTIKSATLSKVKSTPSKRSASKNGKRQKGLTEASAATDALKGSRRTKSVVAKQGGRSKKAYKKRNKLQTSPASYFKYLRSASAAIRSSKPAPPPAPLPDTPLLLLPDSHSVWQSGTYQTVKWSRKYSRSLPQDTTVDIILVDAKTNRKLFSLKRFIPLRRGSAQVLVPTHLPEGVSFVLVLELYRGRSQEQVTSTVLPPSSTYDGQQQQQQQQQQQKQQQEQQQPRGQPLASEEGSSRSLSTVVRRSDINIASTTRKAAAKDVRPRPQTGSRNTETKAVESTAGYDVNNSGDYYVANKEELPFGFLPGESREEYPNTVQPLVLEHTFGLHQKVYTMTPYTLEWKIPARVAELLDYTRQVYMAANVWMKNGPSRQSALPDFIPKSTFLAKVLVELVSDHTMETVSVLARDVPAETMFLYLSIQDRVPQAFYRLRVQMVIVQVEGNIKTLAEEYAGGSGSAVPGKQSKGMEGWEFPKGGQVIDRYEAVTRRFWVSQGAL
ncbi:hypothetical protein BGX34_005761 [Mortierella sp. NVP85]|nr:hypothetical protein BGX34_005761 [Mortierella sp. NVP85]